MALINCTECSKSISDQSIACPSCGFPNKLQANSSNERIKSRPSPERHLKKQKETKNIENAMMFIIFCIAIYIISGDEISYITQYLVEAYSK